MSLGIQCVQNTSCPTAQMFPVKPRAPSYKKGNCLSRQRSYEKRIMLVTIISFASSLPPPCCISIQHRNLEAHGRVTFRQKPVTEKIEGFVSNSHNPATEVNGVTEL